MGQFGDELRVERERRGIVLEDLCAATKLSIRQLQDLEAENYGDLPGGVFRKGFVRSYLGAVGLDETAWLERFEASLRESGFDRTDEANWSGFAENVKNGRVVPEGATGRTRWLGVAGMVLALLLLGWSVWKFVVHPAMRRSDGSAVRVGAAADVGSRGPA